MAAIDRVVKAKQYSRKKKSSIDFGAIWARWNVLIICSAGLLAYEFAARYLLSVFTIMKPEMVRSTSSTCAGLLNGFVSSFLSGRALWKRGTVFKISTPIRRDADICFQWFVSYMIADSIFTIIFQGEFLYLLHHIGCALCVCCFWYMDIGEICMLSYIFLGEVTNGGFNSWLVAGQVATIKESVHAAQAYYLEGLIASISIVPFTVVRFILSPIVVYSHFVAIRRAPPALKSKFSPSWLPYVWTIIGSSLAPGSMPVWFAMIEDAKRFMFEN